MISQHSRYFALDPNARTFINNNEIERPADIWAIDQRAKLYKAAGLWTKMMAIYPMVKDVTCCTKNMVPNANDFSMIYNNAALPVYTAANGLDFNNTYATVPNIVGSSGGGDTSKEWGGGNRSIQSAGFWSTFANTNNTDADIGLTGGTGSAGNIGTVLAIRKGNLSLSDHVGSNSRASYTPESDGLGLFAMGYNESTLNTIWKNGTQMATGANSGVVGTNAFIIGSSNTVNKSTKKYGMFFIAGLSGGSRLTPTEHADLSTIESFIQSNSRF